MIELSFNTRTRATGIALVAAILSVIALTACARASAVERSGYLPVSKYIDHQFANRGLFYFGLKARKLTVTLVGTAVAKDGRTAIVGFKIPDNNDSNLCDCVDKIARTRVPFILMLNSDGSRDETFGPRGYRANLGIHRPGEISYQLEQPAFDGAGRLVVATAGMAGRSMTIVRLLANGHRDSTFGSRGRITEPGMIRDLNVESDGSISYLSSVAGVPEYKPPGACFLPASYYKNVTSLAMRTPDGALDPAFATGGRLTLPTLSPITGSRCVQFTQSRRAPDGHFVLFGTAYFLASDAPPETDSPSSVTHPGYSMPILLRVNSDGTVAQQFGTSGFLMPTNPAIPAVTFNDDPGSLAVSSDGSIFAIMNRHAPRSNAEADDAWEDQLLRVDSSGSSNTTALDQPIGAYEKRYHWTIPYVDPTGRALVTRIRSDSGGPIDAAWVEPRDTPLPTWNRWAGPSGDYNPVAMTPLSNGAVLMGGHDNYELDGVKYAISNITLFKLNPPPA